jgi:hypothetical protein
MLRLILPLMGDGDHEPPANYALVELDQRQLHLCMAIIEWFAGQKENVAPLEPWTISFQIRRPRCFDREPKLLDLDTGGYWELGDDYFDLANYPAWAPDADDQPDLLEHAELRFDVESVCWRIFGDYEGMSVPITWHQLAVWAGKLRWPEPNASGAIDWIEFTKCNPIPRCSTLPGPMRGDS